MKPRYVWPLLIIGFCFMGCQGPTLPKPRAMLRLEYPEAEAKQFQSENFRFQYNALARVSTMDDSSFTLDYPGLNGAIFISYKPVAGNLHKLLSDAQKLSYGHVIKADNIAEQPFVNKDNKVYGMYYEVKGDAASQSQFYVTDSTTHFVTGSLYFYAKPNYDSILPAAAYLQNDIRTLMESLRWK